MLRAFAPSAVLATVGPPVIAIVSVYALSLLPSRVFDLAMVWTALSLPPAILFGHCALSSER